MDGAIECHSEKCIFIFRLTVAPKLERKNLSKKSERTYFSPF
jgi:hypothetical protein